MVTTPDDNFESQNQRNNGIGAQIFLVLYFLRYPCYFYPVPGDDYQTPENENQRGRENQRDALTGQPPILPRAGSQGLLN